jgi:DeoR/GlpR family transcriptional regulator of sugar metabolism
VWYHSLWLGIAFGDLVSNHDYLKASTTFMRSVISNYERQLQIQHFIEERQRVSIEELCSAFDISSATVRRDLDVLETMGRIKRFHGGAIAMHNAPLESPIHLRAVQEVEAKRRIGQAAAALVKDGESIFLGSGTTVLEIANNLRERRITVITNSLLVTNALAGQSTIELVNVGGVLRHSEFSFIGHITQQALAELHVGKVFMGIHAIHPEMGLMSEYLPETQTDRAIISIGRQIVIAADHTKCNRTSTTFVAPLSAVHTLVTDTETPRDFLDELSKRYNIHIITA